MRRASVLPQARHKTDRQISRVTTIRSFIQGGVLVSPFAWLTLLDMLHNSGSDHDMNKQDTLGSLVGSEKNRKPEAGIPWPLIVDSTSSSGKAEVKSPLQSDITSACLSPYYSSPYASPDTKAAQSPHTPPANSPTTPNDAQDCPSDVLLLLLWQIVFRLPLFLYHCFLLQIPSFIYERLHKKSQPRSETQASDLYCDSMPLMVTRLYEDMQREWMHATIVDVALIP